MEKWFSIDRSRGRTGRQCGLEDIFMVLYCFIIMVTSHECHGISNHHQLYYLFEACSPLLAICEGNPPGTGGFPSQSASNGESVSMS